MISRVPLLDGSIRVVTVLVVAAGMSGCAIVTSHKPIPTAAPSGMLYHLPKAVLPVELVSRGGALELRVQPSRQVADPQHRYLLKHPTNVFASDNVKVEWDTSGLLLSKLTMDRAEETLNVLKEVAKGTAIGRAEAAAAAGEVILAAGDFDPDLGASEGTNARLMNDLHAALRRNLDQWATQCARKDLKPEDKPDPVNCAMADQLSPRLANKESVLQISAAPMGGAPVEGAVVADCTVGLCYRGQQPFVLGLEVKDLFSRRTVLMLPNKSPAIALALDGAPFVKTEHTVEFLANGSLKSVETKRPSSALQAVSWPLDVYKAVLTATSELITLRIGAKDKEVALAQKELDTAKELKRLADEMEAFNKAKNKTEAAGPGSGSSALVSIPLGRAGGNAGSLLPTTPTGDCKAGEPCPGVK